MKEFKLASFFSGCGGLDLGLKGGFTYADKKYPSTGLSTVFANDINKKACKSYQANFNHKIINDSIENVALNRIEADVVVGGFPCQPFSYSGKRLGENDPRGKLYLSMLEAVKTINPKVFLMENVKGILDIDNGETISKIINEFSSLGYNVNYQLYQAYEYGIPQSRSRVFIVGLNRDDFNDDFFAHPQSTDRRLSTYDVLHSLDGSKEGDLPNHYWSKAKKNNGQGNKAINRDSFSPTIRAEHHGNIEFHYNNERRLSAREVARLQSFPDDFIFYDSTSDAYRQIGNAVPPVLGWYLGNDIAKYLSM